MNYLRAFQQAESKLQSGNYVGCIRDCGTLVEVGLKELYQRQIDWEEDKNSIERLVVEFREKFHLFSDFEPSRSSLFPLLKFFHSSRMWNKIQVRVSSNLHFTKRIPWKDLRFIRNEATHSIKDFTREQAVEFLHHVKLFLHECELAETKPAVLFENHSECHNCGLSLQKNWNFCPDCGKEQKACCMNCKRDLDLSWKTCPYCETPRTADLFIEETNRLYKAYCEAVWADDVVNAEERELLQRKRLELGISQDMAERIESEVVPAEIFQFMDLISAVLIDGIIDQIEMEFLKNNAKRLKIPQKRARKLIASMYNEESKPLV